MKGYFKARSPAKLILSGEHAVVYGKPALAMAIDRYAESTINANLSKTILFHCLNFRYAKSFTLQALDGIKHRLQDKYHAFLEGRCGIRDVLKTPFELLQYTVTHLLETLNVTLSEGLEIRASSEIPVGCGMGSSAAIVMSTLYALGHFLKLEIDPVRFLALGREAENLQHGYSSGLDLHLAMKGGCLRFDEGATVARNVPNVPLRIVQTGKPLATTGQCVSQVAKHFKTTSIGNDFAAVTELFDQALQANDIAGMQACIRQNHRLLVEIGVVPPKVQAFIRAIENEGGAAKICGAGSVVGDNAGVVLVVSEKTLSDITDNYGYQFQSVQGDLYGTHIV
jgi:mevalonate kinase